MKFSATGQQRNSQQNLQKDNKNLQQYTATAFLLHKTQQAL